MGRKNKIIKKTSVSQGAENIRKFLASEAKVVDDTYILKSDEEEITNFDNARILKEVVPKDVDARVFRGLMQRIDEIKGGAEYMTDSEKNACASAFAFSNPMDTLTEVPDLWDRVWFGFSDFHQPAIEARKRRFQFCSSIIYNCIDSATAAEIINKFVTPTVSGNVNMWTSYVEFGIEGTEFGDAEAIIDYIESVVGTEFENNGLKESLTGKIYPNLTITEDDIIKFIKDCLVGGIYYRPL